MDILLINPSQKNVYGIGVKPPYPPLGLLYLGAALLKNGCSVEIIDFDIDIKRKDNFFDYVKENHPGVIGFTAVTPCFNNALSLAGAIKKIYSPFIIFGGPHTTALPEEVIKEETIDGVVIGEGEETVAEFMNYFKQGKVVAVDGIIIKDKGRFLRGRKRDFIENLDELPFPAWSLLKHPMEYSPPDARDMPVATVMSSRGCPYRCTFCQAPRIWGRKIRRRSVDNVVAEIKFLKSRYGIKEIHIADDDFTHNKEWTLDFLRKVEKERVGTRFYFMNGLRIDNVDMDILLGMKRAGFVSIGFGVESGSQRILNSVKKGLKIAGIEKNFKMVKGLGFKTWAFFILGFLGETPSSLKETVDFSISLDPDFAKYFYLVPFPGTDVYKELLTKNLLLDRNFSNYGLYMEPVYELPGLSRYEIKKALTRAYIKFYLRPSKIFKILFRIRSLTELKLNMRAVLFLLRKIITV